jgi:hypothetical protein
MNNSDLPAMPIPNGADGAPWSVNEMGNPGHVFGLTKREYFAARAMEAIIASKHFEIQWWDQDEKQDSFAKSAWGYADAMLNAQEKEPAQ